MIVLVRTFASPMMGKGQAEHSCTKASRFQKLWVGEPAETRHHPEQKKMLLKHLDSKVAGSREHENEPRLVGQILSARFASGNDAFAHAYRRQHLNSSRKEVVAL